MENISRVSVIAMPIALVIEVDGRFQTLKGDMVEHGNSNVIF
jgi:hypothetical protein